MTGIDLDDLRTAGVYTIGSEPLAELPAPEPGSAFSIVVTISRDEHGHIVSTPRMVRHQ